MTQVETLRASTSSTRSMNQFVKYVFFKLDPMWKRMNSAQAQHAKHEFFELLEKHRDDIHVRIYSLVGTRADVDFMFWIITDSLLKIQEFHSKIMKSNLGRYLYTPYSFLAMFRPSEYFGKTSTDSKPVGSQYLFVYPLTKKREWYSIPFEDRKRIMKDHVQIGVKYSSVTIHTAYSFGIDDYEFVLSFETDYPQDFVNLVMELRSSEASRYTATETPLFTCVISSAEQVLDQIG